MTQEQFDLLIEYIDMRIQTELRNLHVTSIFDEIKTDLELFEQLEKSLVSGE
jgi:hypothetical protein